MVIVNDNLLLDENGVLHIKNTYWYRFNVKGGFEKYGLAFELKYKNNDGHKLEILYDAQTLKYKFNILDIVYSARLFTLEIDSKNCNDLINMLYHYYTEAVKKEAKKEAKEEEAKEPRVIISAGLITVKIGNLAPYYFNTAPELWLDPIPEHLFTSYNGGSFGLWVRLSNDHQKYIFRIMDDKNVILHVFELSREKVNTIKPNKEECITPEPLMHLESNMIMDNTTFKERKELIGRLVDAAILHIKNDTQWGKLSIALMPVLEKHTDLKIRVAIRNKDNQKALAARLRELGYSVDDTLTVYWSDIKMNADEARSLYATKLDEIVNSVYTNCVADITHNINKANNTSKTDCPNKVVGDLVVNRLKAAGYKAKVYSRHNSGCTWYYIQTSFKPRKQPKEGSSLIAKVARVAPWVGLAYLATHANWPKIMWAYHNYVG